jgi:hypothetical protein
MIISFQFPYQATQDFLKVTVRPPPTLSRKKRAGDDDDFLISRKA